MVLIHDFKQFPELTNLQMETLYFDSPHRQIVQDFRAKVFKVVDGDTVRLETDFRDFDFPMRFLDINAPEMNEDGGKESRAWLKSKIGNLEVNILINTENRVDKFGRLLGRVMSNGLDVGEEMMHLGLAKPFELRNEGKLPNLNKELNIKKWF